MSRHERDGTLNHIREAEKHDQVRRQSVADYMRGDIDYEEFREINDNLPPILDLRAIASWQMRMDRRRKIEAGKDKIKSVMRKMKDLVS